MAAASPLKGEGDRFLIASIRQGDQQGFRRLVDRFGGRLSTYAARRLSGTGIDPDDAVQETFLGLLQSIDRIEKVRSLQAYLFQILRHKIADLTGKRPEAHGMHRVPLAGETPSGDAGGLEPVAREGTPSSYVRRDEAAEVRDRVLADILEEAISGLKAESNFRDLKILELLFYAGARGDEAAAAAGTSEPTVTRVKQRALEALARLAARHPLFDRSFDLAEAGDDASQRIRLAWRENLISCLKRSTLGAYALGAVDAAWGDYIAFHIDKVGCEVCAANLSDLRNEGAPVTPESRERIFASSIGFLRRPEQK